jgi:hypothetical protein
MKSRDAFDINFLLANGARLGTNLKAHLQDFLSWNEFDSESIRARIDRIETKQCTTELRPVLPEGIFASLSHEHFKALRTSLETVFADWL